MPKKYEAPHLRSYGTVEALTASLGNPSESDYFYAHPDSTVTSSGPGVGSENTCERPLDNPTCPGA